MSLGASGYAPRQAAQAGSPPPSVVSIVSMNWAWGRRLKPTTKLVLM
jgi:hypothetical protein